MKLSFVITNDKASYVPKEDSILLFSVAKKAVRNKQRIKPFFFILVLKRCPYHQLDPGDLGLKAIRLSS